MQIQEIMTYTAVAAASSFVLYNLYKTLFAAPKSQHGCSSGCNCDAKVLRKELLSNKR
jgi:hypothetical protein